MLITENFPDEFYKVVRDEHPLILVNCDVDALCASYILRHALACDCTTYSVVAVDCLAAVEKALQDYHECRFVIMINCGGYTSLLDLEMSPSIVIFVVDSRRPFHLDNIYNRENIRILVNAGEVDGWKVPNVESVYQDSDTDESDDDEAGGEEMEESRAAALERRILKRQQRTQWKKQRHDLLWEYYGRTWYAMPSSVLFFELVQRLGKANVEAMWCAAVGLCSQLADGLITMTSYSEVLIDNLNNFAAKYAPKANSDTHCDDVLKISQTSDILLPLYTRWTLLQSMIHDVSFCCANVLWSQKGDSTLKHTLATIGITLSECNQFFDSLPVDRKKTVFDILYKHLDSKFVTFFAHYGYSQRFSALDFARILALRLELHPNGNMPDLMERYNAAQQLVSDFLKLNGERAQLDAAVAEYKMALNAVRGLVFTVLKHNMVAAAADNFLLLILEPSADVVYLRSRHCLNMFVSFALSGFASSKNKKRSMKPFVVVIPSVKVKSDENNRFLLVTGCVSYHDLLTQEDRESWLPRAFLQAIKTAKIPSWRDSFDPNAVRIRHEDRAKFVNSLDIVLETY